MILYCFSGDQLLKRHSSLNKNMFTAVFRLACLEIRSRNYTRNMIYSVFYFLLYRHRYFYLFLNWFRTRVSDDQKYLCGSRLYACINTRKFKGLDSREITSLPDIKKNDLHGTSFQSSPKIDRILNTRLICIQWKFTTPDRRKFANYDSYFFFDHSVAFTCSKVINAFKQ